MRHLFYTLDGPTTGATTISGTIGKTILSCELLPIASFQLITSGHGISELSTGILINLSKYQQYLDKIIQAVRRRHVPDDLARQRLAH